MQVDKLILAASGSAAGGDNTSGPSQVGGNNNQVNKTTEATDMTGGLAKQMTTVFTMN